MGAKQTSHMGKKKQRLFNNLMRKPSCSHLTARTLSTGGMVLTKNEKQTTAKIYSFLTYYLKGAGCCLYCWETNPWMLNHHHPWKKIDSDFTITLCENHHAPLSRYMPFLLKEWRSPPDKQK